MFSRPCMGTRFDLRDGLTRARIEYAEETLADHLTVNDVEITPGDFRALLAENGVA